MRITKTLNQVIAENKRKEIANLGCDRCPCCGETRRLIDCLKEGKFEGISGGLVSTTYETGLFKSRILHADCYSCSTCGAQWESDPY